MRFYGRSFFRGYDNPRTYSCTEYMYRTLAENPVSVRCVMCRESCGHSCVMAKLMYARAVCMRANRLYRLCVYTTFRLSYNFPCPTAVRPTTHAKPCHVHDSQFLCMPLQYVLAVP